MKIKDAQDNKIMLKRIKTFGSFTFVIILSLGIKKVLKLHTAIQFKAYVLESNIQ